MNDMNERHPETELIAYLKDELPPASREAVVRHVDGCAECREALVAFRGLPEGLNSFEEVVLGTRLDLLRQYPVVERLDLLEDLDVIRQLDGLAGRREG